MIQYIPHDSALNICVTGYENHFQKKPYDVNLIRWLTTGSHEALQELVATSTTDEEKKYYKSMLPVITPSLHRGNHTGFICLDFDYKDNTEVKNFPYLISEFAKLEFVAYAGKSVSGTGYWLLVKISKPEKHKAHFDSLKRYFAEFGLTVDRSKSNINALRYYAIDRKSYANHYPKAYTGLYEEQRKEAPVKYEDKDELPYRYVDAILNCKVDVTQTYEDWRKIAFAFADTYGENGRSLFHTVSQFHNSYRPSETDYLFSNVLKHSKGVHSIGSFIWICKGYGIDLKEAKPTA